MARNSQDLRRLGDRRGFIWDARTAQVVWFGVGIATAIRWVRRSREPGDSGLGRLGPAAPIQAQSPSRLHYRPYRRDTDMTISEMLERPSTPM